MKAQLAAEAKAAAKAKKQNESSITKVNSDLPDEKKIEETEKNSRKIIKITIRKSGVVTVYRKVTHAWGAIYYFREMENISKTIFENETEL